VVIGHFIRYCVYLIVVLGLVWQFIHKQEKQNSNLS